MREEMEYVSMESAWEDWYDEYRMCSVRGPKENQKKAKDSWDKAAAEKLAKKIDELL